MKFTPLILAVFLGSCGMFGLEDFPPYLPYVSQVIKIKPLVSPHLSISENQLATANFTKGIDSRKILSLHFWRPNLPPPQGSSIVKPSGVLGVYQDGSGKAFWINDIYFVSPDYVRPSFQIGRTNLGPVSGSVVWRQLDNTVQAFSGYYSGLSNDFSLASLNYISPIDSSSNRYFYFFVNSYQLSLYVYKTNNLLTYSQYKFVTFHFPLSFSSMTQDQLNLIQLLPLGSNKLAALVFDSHNNQAHVWQFTYDPDYSVNPTFDRVLLSNILIRYSYPRRNIWLTSQGIITHPYDGLLVYRPFNGNSVEFTFLGDLIPVGFSEDGEEWAGLQESTGRLFVLRRWWP